MSDFLFSLRPRPPGELRGHLERHLSHVTASATERHGEWGSLAVLLAPHDAEVLREEGDAITVLLGEPLLRTAAGLSGSATAPSRRGAAHALLARRESAAWHRRLDGPMAALAIDTARGAGRVVADLFAWIPLFAAESAPPAAGLVIGTHVDAVAEAAGRAGAFDPISAVELISYFTATFPHTLYPGVEQLPPGTERAFTREGWSGENAYWRPVERTGFSSLAEAAAELREALVESVRAACEGLSPVGALLSGGEDSRAVLGALPPGVDVRAFTFATSENREVRSARRVARAYGASHRYALRDATHDLRFFEEVSELVGTSSMFLDAHTYDLHASLGLRELPVVLGGFSSDALLKGDNVSLRSQRAIRRGRAGVQRSWRPAAIPGIRQELLAAAAERREAFRRQLMEIRPQSADEWTRIYPFTMRKYSANLHGNRRLFRCHEPYMSTRVVELAAATPQAWKIDRRLFIEAMRPLLRRSRFVPHSRNRMPYLSRRANLVARPLLGAARRLHALLTGSARANQESWPIWSELVRTPEMEEKLRRYPIDMARIAPAVGTAPEELASAARAWPPLHRLMLLHLAHLTAPGRGS